MPQPGDVSVPDLLAKRLVIVSGKGGVGKTVISSALGLVAARRGKRVLLVKMDDQGRTAQLFGTPPLGDRVMKLTDEISAIQVDPVTVVADYLKKQLKVRRLVDMIVTSDLFQNWFRVSPAIKEMISLGKVQSLVEETSFWRRKATYDLVIFDAPATGHGLGLLRLPEQASKLLIGGMRKNALSVQALLQDHRSTSLVLVAIPEEMPVTETIHFYEGAQAIGMPLGCVVLNGAHADRCSAEQVEALAASPAAAAAVRSLVGATAGSGAEAGALDDGAIAAALTRAGSRSVSQRQLTERYAAQLRAEVALPLLEVPHLATESFGMDDLKRIANHLATLLPEGDA
jgi:anion-transporting  ArsA/GET3 family ATPase